MNVLIACEESQVECIEFRKKGHNAFSCDIQSCSGGHPEWHINTDVREVLNGGTFITESGSIITVRDWDLIIAHPPCTDLSASGARWFAEKQKNGSQQKSIDFFMLFTNLKCEKVAIENPIGIMSTKYRKPDQIIQPWMFGHGETKATCLWLKNLPLLIPTDIVEGRENRIWRMPPSADRGKLRSKSYPGIAKAMSEQWG